MHCHCGTNDRAPRLTFTDPCKTEVKPGAREESASPAWQAAKNDGFQTIVMLLVSRLGVFVIRLRHILFTSLSITREIPLS